MVTGLWLGRRQKEMATTPTIPGMNPG